MFRIFMCIVYFIFIRHMAELATTTPTNQFMASQVMDLSTHRLNSSRTSQLVKMFYFVVNNPCT